MSQKILAVALPSEQYTLLQQKAIAQQKEVAQLGLEIIRNWLRQQTEIEENTASESKDEAVHEAEVGAVARRSCEERSNHEERSKAITRSCEELRGTKQSKAIPLNKVNRL